MGFHCERLGPQECQQVSVDFILKRSCEAVRCTRIVYFLRALDESWLILSAASLTGTIWSSSPCMTRVGTSIFLRSSVKSVSAEGLDTFVGVLEAGLHAPEPELIQFPARPWPLACWRRRTRGPGPCRIASDPWLGPNACRQTLPSAGPPDWWRTSA